MPATQNPEKAPFAVFLPKTGGEFATFYSRQGCKSATFLFFPLDISVRTGTLGLQQSISQSLSHCLIKLPGLLHNK